jgi:hypothetical protein
LEAENNQELDTPGPTGILPKEISAAGDSGCGKYQLQGIMVIRNISC